MNQTFDIHRFGKLLKKDFRSIWPLFGVPMIIILACTMIPWIMKLAFGDILFQTIHPVFRMFMIGMAVYLVACIAPSRLYNNCNRPKEGIYFAMLPASKLEKYLSMILMSIIVCPLFCLCGGIVIDYLLYLVPFGGYDATLFSVVSTFRELLPCFDYETLNMLYCITNPLFIVLCYLSSVIIFFFTTTIFKSHKFLYTILWLFLISFVWNNIVGVLMVIFSLNSDGGWLVELVDRLGEHGGVTLMHWMFNGTMIFNALFTLLLGWWSWVRLKKMKY